MTTPDEPEQPSPWAPPPASGAEPPPEAPPPAGWGQPPYGAPPGPPYGAPPGQPPYGYAQPPGQGPWGYGTPPYGYAAPRNTNGFAIASFVCAFLCSPLGLVFGVIALSQINRTHENGRGLAIAGLVISGLSVVLGIIVFAAAVSTSTSSGIQ